jgi:glucose-6-phosphate isomerase
MIDVKIDITNIHPFISGGEISAQQENISSLFNALISKTGKGNDFLGWIDLPTELTDELINDINTTADKTRKLAEVFVVIGIGGSYLGARAVIEALSHSFCNQLPSGNPQIIYAGHNISEDYFFELLELLDKKDYAIVAISKSGTTTEPAIAFRMLKNHLEKKYGKKGAAERIIAVTDKARGALKQIANTECYHTYVIPDDVGGRYSVLTPVGLLPVAVAGFDIRKIINGAKLMREHLIRTPELKENPAALYAVARNLLYKKGRTIEIMVNYYPKIAFFAEWWKQLYGESEGKENKGIFPAAVNFTTDLHSLGQYIQDGLRNIFETVISVEKPKREVKIPYMESDLDEINYISGKRLHEVNKMAELGTLQAHLDGKVPNMIITVPQINEEIIGQLIYFFEFACALSGYMLGVNPFDQPGVEAYKKNMFKLLGKSGYV